MNENFEQINHRVVWGMILPEDTARQAQNEQLLVQAGVHSRRTAMDELGIQDPDEEFNRNELKLIGRKGVKNESRLIGNGSA
jgi:hypothetical protein